MAVCCDMSNTEIDHDLLAELEDASESVRSFEYGYLLLSQAIEDIRDVLEEVEEATQDLADPAVLQRIQAISEQLQLIDQPEDYEDERYENDDFESPGVDPALTNSETNWSFEELGDAFEELKLDLDDLIPEMTQALEDHLASLQEAAGDEVQIQAFEARADRFSKAAWDAYEYLTRVKFIEL
jgi:hypothetical protein